MTTNSLTNMDTYAVPYLWGAVMDNRMRPTTLTIKVPGSKSITNRALLLAALAQGGSVLKGALFSEDSRAFLDCIQRLGIAVQAEEEAKTIRISGRGGAVSEQEASLYVGSAGTAARFLTAWLGISKGVYHMEASPQMKVRPMAPLLATLRTLGCEIKFGEKEGFFPFTLHGQGFGSEKNAPVRLKIDIDQSSQFLSGLLMSAPLSEQEAEIQIIGSHGMSYVEMTRRMMEQFGVRIHQEAQDDRVYRIEAGQQYRGLDYQIEPDVSAACYFYAMAPLLGVRIMVENVYLDSIQGDVQFLRILERMGCTITEMTEGIAVQGNSGGAYQGIRADLSSCSDQAITLAALAPFAKSPTIIEGIGHIRYQESDRIHAIATELTRMGIHCVECQDSLTIYPGEPKPALIQTYEDHRMAMGFALIGLRAKGIIIDHPDCCKKTFENYFEVLDKAAGDLVQ